MATPHVAGLVAYLLSVNGNVSPATMQSNIKSLSTKNALTGIRECLPLRPVLSTFSDMAFLASGTVNYLAYNGV